MQELVPYLDKLCYCYSPRGIYLAVHLAERNNVFITLEGDAYMVGTRSPVLCKTKEAVHEELQRRSKALRT